jgi:hypothetical protein
MKAFTFLILILASAPSLSAKAWRGIEPLRSTRSDVVRLFGQCWDQREACVFTLENEDVYVLFSGGMTKDYGGCSEDVPAETVMFIETWPHSGNEFHDFKFAKQEFRELSHTTFRKTTYRSYLNQKDQLLLKTRNGKAIQAVYLPTASELRKCQDFYEPLESFVGIFQGHVPVISFGCPTAVTEGQQIVVQGFSNFASRRGFEWTISEGKIVAGQHTTRITIDTNGVISKSINIQAEMQDHDLGHVVFCSCDVELSKKP